MRLDQSLAWFLPRLPPRLAFFPQLSQEPSHFPFSLSSLTSVPASCLGLKSDATTTHPDVAYPSSPHPHHGRYCPCCRRRKPPTESSRGVAGESRLCKWIRLRGGRWAPWGAAPAEPGTLWLRPCPTGWSSAGTCLKWYRPHQQRGGQHIE